MKHFTTSKNMRSRLQNNSDVPVVSALFDIGVIPGTETVSRKDPANYLKWMEIFKSIMNPVVFFTDKTSNGTAETRTGDSGKKHILNLSSKMT